MQVITYDHQMSIQEELSVALGYFDGMHIAHQQIIKEAVTHAIKHHQKSAVLTFSPNPNVFLNKITHQTLLTPLPEKIRLLRKLKVDYLIVIPFTKQMAQIEANDFLTKLLTDFKIHHVVTGFDFRFGYRGLGDVSLLRRDVRFSTQVVEKQMLAQEKIGTTQIREHLACGEVEVVTRMLGRHYRIVGHVVSGRQQGRTIGFPTANIALEDEYAVPSRGVYAVLVRLNGKQYQGMCNIGHNPTFNYNEQMTIEVNIFDFNEQIYGECIELMFVTFIRQEQRFSGVEALISQLKADKIEIQQFFVGNDVK